MRRLLMLAVGLAPAAGIALPVTGASASAAGSHRAGTCTVTVDYTMHNVAEIFDVSATSNSCTGGGTIKYQAEFRCSGGPGPDFYGQWENGTGALSAATDGNCASSGHSIVAGSLRINMNNPIRKDCWVPGDSLNGSCTFST